MVKNTISAAIWEFKLIHIHQLLLFFCALAGSSAAWSIRFWYDLKNATIFIAFLLISLFCSEWFFFIFVDSQLSECVAFVFVRHLDRIAQSNYIHTRVKKIRIKPTDLALGIHDKLRMFVSFFRPYTTQLMQTRVQKLIRHRLNHTKHKKKSALLAALTFKWEECVLVRA